MDFTVRPLTRDRWSALEELFTTTGPVSRCWCMYWRIGNDYRRRSGATNKAAFRDLVESGPPPGLLAFHGDLVVGWCQLTPRLALPWLDHSWRLKGVDELPVWSLSCFYVRKGFRKRGVTSSLIRAALATAKRQGAPALEAYPLDSRLSPSATGTGYVSTFERLGFKIVAQRVLPRPVMRYDLQNLDDLLPSPPYTPSNPKE